MSEVFPADDQVACWLFVAFQWISDLWTLEATAQDHALALSPDFLFFWRLVVGRFYEGERVVKAARRMPEVMAFIEGLPGEAVAAFDQLEAAYVGAKESWAYRELKQARNLVSHYPQPDSIELHDILETIAASETVFVADERTGRVRFLTADQAVMTASFRSDPNAVMARAGELMQPIAQLRRSAAVLFDQAQRAYFPSRDVSPKDVRVLIRKD